VETGDDLEVDFQNGKFKNLSQNYSAQFKPLDSKLQSVIEVGGWHANLEQRLSKIKA
jgi:hypothetical protein